MEPCPEIYWLSSVPDNQLFPLSSFPLGDSLSSSSFWRYCPFCCCRPLKPSSAPYFSPTLWAPALRGVDFSTYCPALICVVSPGSAWTFVPRSLPSTSTRSSAPLLSVPVHWGFHIQWLSPVPPTLSHSPWLLLGPPGALSSPLRPPRDPLPLRQEVCSSCQLQKVDSLSLASFLSRHLSALT